MGSFPNYPLASPLQPTDLFLIDQSGVTKGLEAEDVISGTSVNAALYGTTAAGIAAADAQAVAIGSWVDFSDAGTITLTGNTVFSAPWRKFGGSGNFVTGSFNLTGDISAEHYDQVFDPGGSGVITITGDGFPQGLSFWNFGGKASSMVDDSGAMNRAAACAGASNRPLFTFAPGMVFYHASPIVVPHTVPAVDLRSVKAQYTGSADVAQWTFGDSSTGYNFRPAYFYMPYTQRTTSSDWTQTNCVGTRVYNLKDCIECSWAGGQFARIGLQLYATLDSAYNVIQLGAVNGGCQWCVEFYGTGGAFINNNTLINGDFFCAPTTNPTLNRGGLHVGGDGSYNHNANVWTGSPALQIAKPASASADLIWCEYANYNKFDNIRAEALNANLLRTSNDSSNNTVSYTYNTCATLKNQEGRYANNTIYAGLLFGTDDSSVSSLGRVSWCSPPGNQIYEYDGSGTGALAGMCAISSATTPVYSVGSSAFTYHPHYGVLTGGSVILARRLQTRDPYSKLFTLSVATAGSFMGRHRFRPLDDWEGQITWSATVRSNGGTPSQGDINQITSVAGLGLYCLTAGTNAGAPPTIPHNIGACVADGTTVWVVIAAPVRGPVNSSLSYSTSFGGSWSENSDSVQPVVFSVERHGALPTVAINTVVTLGQHYVTSGNDATYLVATAVGGGTAPGSTGTTAGSPPTYNLLPTQTTTDGTVTWTAFQEVVKCEVGCSGGTNPMHMIGMTLKAGDSLGEVTTSNPLGYRDGISPVSAPPATMGKYGQGEVFDNVVATTATTADWRCATAGVMTATAYANGTVVTGTVYSNASKAYLCVNGGTAATAPTSTAAGVFILDTSIAWQYLGALAVFIAGTKNQ